MPLATLYDTIPLKKWTLKKSFPLIRRYGTLHDTNIEENFAANETPLTEFDPITIFVHGNRQLGELSLCRKYSHVLHAFFRKRE